MSAKLPDEEPQIQRFQAIAKELGCDEDKNRFETMLAKIAKRKRASPRHKQAMEKHTIDTEK